MERNRNYFIPIQGIGLVEDTSASVDLCSIPEYTPEMYLYLEKLNFSVSKASVGGDGVCEIKDDRGNVIWSIATDVVKDVPLDFGGDGVKVNDQPVTLIQGVVSGADTQATVSISITAHMDRR